MSIGRPQVSIWAHWRGVRNRLFRALPPDPKWGRCVGDEAGLWHGRRACMSQEQFTPTMLQHLQAAATTCLQPAAATLKQPWPTLLQHTAATWRCGAASAAAAATSISARKQTTGRSATVRGVIEPGSGRAFQCEPISCL